MIHALKTEPNYFNAVINGKKPFEVRKNDRDFRECDYIALNEWQNGTVDNYPQGYTGRSALYRITYILDNPELCKEGYVVMGLEKCHICNGCESKPQNLLYGQARGGGEQ